ncbi:MAG: exo-alpha-sialidase, partial [Planctomycetes bacterium]|nr:exo-alpha-sialidase [Planctomycetota bacterium]
GAPRFDPEPQPPVNYVIVDPAHGSGCGNLVRAPGGDVLVNIAGVLWHSADNGRTWQAGPTNVSGGLWRIAPDGSLEAYWTTHEPPFVLRKAVSTDEGETWSEPRVVSNIQFPEDAPFAVLYPGRLLETQGGALLIFAYSGMPSETEILHGRYYRSLTPPVAWNVCLRSTDGGESWSAPINMDGPPHDDQRWMVWKEASEISVAQRVDGKIMALIRPFRSPLMWETWSEDEGQTWTPAHRGPFGMWACHNSMLRTASGALVIAGRHPGLGFNLSYDDGMTWQCYRFDTTFWANGFVCEIEPNVVMYASTAKYSDPHVRVHLFRITPEGPEPVRYGETEQ